MENIAQMLKVAHKDSSRREFVNSCASQKGVFIYRGKNDEVNYEFKDKSILNFNGNKVTVISRKGN